MLLKIGKTYINTDNVVEYLWDGDRVTVYYNTNDETGDAFTTTIKGEEAFALLRWLDAQATDIMATEAAPVETPRNDNAIPMTMRAFVIGQTVRVRDDVDGEASGYTGRTGQVTHLDRSRASGVVRYFTTLSTHDAFYADELEPAD